MPREAAEGRLGTGEGPVGTLAPRGTLRVGDGSQALPVGRDASPGKGRRGAGGCGGSSWPSTQPAAGVGALGSQEQPAAKGRDPRCLQGASGVARSTQPQGAQPCRAPVLLEAPTAPTHPRSGHRAALSCLATGTAPQPCPLLQTTPTPLKSPFPRPQLLPGTALTQLEPCALPKPPRHPRGRSTTARGSRSPSPRLQLCIPKQHPSARAQCLRGQPAPAAAWHGAACAHREPEGAGAHSWPWAGASPTNRLWDRGHQAPTNCSDDSVRWTRGQPARLALSCLRQLHAKRLLGWHPSASPPEWDVGRWGASGPHRGAQAAFTPSSAPGRRCGQGGGRRAARACRPRGG